MPCNCAAADRRIYCSIIQLWSDMHGGLPAGNAINLKPVEVTVCTTCGNAQFKIPEEDMRRWFRRP